MAFWGVEIRPGKPYSHQRCETGGRLHISQATLGNGVSEKRITLQCNVGQKSPILLCSLLSDKTECCSLDLEFDEIDDVIFSVLGPRSIHLTGYYLGLRRNSQHSDSDANSYGEDIVETENDESSNYGTDNDKYEEDFIDDGEPEIYSPSPCTESGVVLEEITNDKKPSRLNRKRSKKYQRIVSDDDSYQEPIIVEDASAPSLKGDDEEDVFPLSSFYGNKIGVKNENSKRLDTHVTNPKKRTLQEASEEGICLKRMIDHTDTGEATRDDVTSSETPVHTDGVEAESGAKKRKKKKKIMDEEKMIELGNTLIDKSRKMNLQVFTQKNENISHGENTEIDNLNDVFSRKNEMEKLPKHDNSDIGKRGKKKKKKKAQDEETQEIATVGEAIVSEKQSHDLRLDSGDMRTFQPLDASVERMEISNKVTHGDVQTEDKRKKTRKKNDKMLDSDIKENAEEMEKKRVENQQSGIQIFPNGLIIEKLSFGKSDGKSASSGDKVFVHYTGKLKKTGEIFETNASSKPFKFRLGKGHVIKGWEAGLNGMLVGEKRRLTIPPSMGYGSKEVGKIPANSWLVFDVEMVDVQQKA